MIITRLMGGLGNQMFQYAFGLYLAKINNTKLYIDTSLLAEEKPEVKYAVHRDFDLDMFDIEFAHINSNILFDYGCTNNGNLIKKVVRKIRNIVLEKPNILIQNSHDFEKEHLKAKDNLCIVGRWQSDRYFNNNKEQVIKSFIFKDQLLAKNEIYASEIINSNSVAIHFRRGDYVSNEFYSKNIGALQIDYYKKAIEYLKQKVNNPKFYIFSDDINWVKSNFTGDNFTYVSQEKNKRGMKEDLHLISLCKNHIISNSTFAWWGAYLANGNIVVAPKKWANSKDFVPPFIHIKTWITI